MSDPISLTPGKFSALKRPLLMGFTASLLAVSLAFPYEVNGHEVGSLLTLGWWISGRPLIYAFTNLLLTVTYQLSGISMGLPANPIIFLAAVWFLVGTIIGKLARNWRTYLFSLAVMVVLGQPLLWVIWFICFVLVAMTFDLPII